MKNQKENLSVLKVKKASIVNSDFDRPGREDFSKRQRNSKVFSLGSNQHQAVFFHDPIHFRDRVTGKWEEIDNTLQWHAERKKNGEDYAFLQNKQNDDLSVTMFPSGESETICIQNRDGESLSWELKDAAHTIPEMLNLPHVQDNNTRRSVLDQIESGVIYRNIFENVDAKCMLQSVRFKDEFIFNSEASIRPISFKIHTSGLKMVQNADNSVQVFNDSQNEAFWLPAPVLRDAKGCNIPIIVTLEQSEEPDKWLLTYTPKLEKTETYVYPIILDPVVITRKDANAIEDNFVTSMQPGTVQPYTATNLRIARGSGSYGTCKAYIKFLGSGLPEIDSSYYVTKAYLVVYLSSTPTASASIYAKDVLSDWSSKTITYNSQPRVSEFSLDYAYMESNAAPGSSYGYDISNSVRSWYAGKNYGLMLEAETNTSLTLYSSDSIINKPYVLINYVSLAGVDEALAYDVQEVGRAGTGNVNLYNGNLVFKHTDTVCTGSLLPLSTSHYYNSCYHDLDIFYAGYGWKMSLQKCLYKETLQDASGYVPYYVYMDEDGTKHYFKQSEGVWKDLSGLSLTLSITGNIATIKDKMDNELFFPLPTEEFNGDYNHVKMLQEIRDANGNLGTLELLEARQLIRTTDGAGRVTAYRILEDGRTEAIIAPGYTEETGLHYEYDDLGRLIKIVHEDGKTTSYTYNQLGLLESAQNIDGLTVSYEYYTERAPYRVKKATISNGNTLGDSCLYEYGDMLTVVTDLSVPNGKKLFYHFNDYGNIVSINDGLGYACFAQYSPDQPINHPQMLSKMQRVVSNFMKNHSFEGNDDWYFYNPTSGNSAGYATDTYYLGERSARLTIGSNLGFASVSQLVTLEKGKTYTFSFYARRIGSVDARIQVNIGDYVVSSQGYGSGLSDEFTRFSYTFTMPTDASTNQARIYLVAENAMGTVWFDCVQLEQGPLMNQYNVLVNGDFSSNLGVPHGWKANASNTSMDAVYATYDGVKPEGLTQNTFRLYGSGRTKYAGIYQDLSLSGKKGDVYTAGGWSMNHSMPRKGENFRYNIRVSFLPTTGGARQNAPSIEWSEEWSEWQFAAGPVIAPCDYSYVRFNVDYERNINYTDFDGFFMFREEFGKSYQYDSNGNIVSTKDLAGKKDNAVYDDFNNMTSYSQPGRASTVKTTLEYGETDDEKKRHLLRKSTSPMGVTQEFKYDAVGNLIQTTAGSLNHTAFIKNEVSYDENLNYPYALVDSYGKTRITYYNPITGNLDYIEDAYGQRINYSYDELKRLKSISTQMGENISRNEYEYAENDQLTKVCHNTIDNVCDVVYTFEYDELRNKTNVKVGGHIISRNVYSSSGEKVLLRIEYGNGGMVHYNYDQFKRIVGIRYDNDSVARYQYTYGSGGQVRRIYSPYTSQTIICDYDSANRIRQIVQSQNNMHLYTSRVSYDTYNNIEKFEEEVFEHDVYTTQFTYDQQNRPVSIRYDTSGGTLAYVYDPLGRILNKKISIGNSSYTTSYEFAEGGFDVYSTTLLVKAVINGEQRTDYTYDDVGNMSSEQTDGYTTSYCYDKLGQLIRVNDPYQNSTWVYTYDYGGNILSKNRYSFTIQEHLDTVLESLTYSYDDTNWKDKLTAYNGKPIAYDVLGNPLSYDGWTFTWEAGHLLQTMSKESVNVQFIYNQNGLRIQKTANNIKTEYIYQGENIVHLRKGNDELHFFYDTQGKPSIVRYNSENYYYLYNLQGDVIAIVDCNFYRVVSYRYDSWGKIIFCEGALKNTLGSLNPFRYRGYVYDEETSLYYLQSRYYNPEFGRFISADNITEALKQLIGINLYAYCANNPISLSDYNGRGFSLANIVSKILSPIVKTVKKMFTSVAAQVQLVVNRVSAQTRATNKTNALEKSRKNNILSFTAPEKNLANSIMYEADKYLWFKGMVDHEKVWDYKIKKPWWAISDSFFIGGEEITFEDYGNLNYGYVGAAIGIPRNILLLGGDYANYTKTGIWGDSEEDKHYINMGVDLYID